MTLLDKATDKSDRKTTGADIVKDIQTLQKKVNSDNSNQLLFKTSKVTWLIQRDITAL